MNSVDFKGVWTFTKAMRIDKYLSSYNEPLLTIDSHFVMKLYPLLHFWESHPHFLVTRPTLGLADEKQS
ncbi:hypothetical protein [Vibrio crassostreae]|uniref:hypothetical protein n=1 Tax=Vibrio crassostreae TaxID=246167 RepID=UPI00063A056F|nr:hypothetical protein [Vibrio crassostreae]CDT64455.1 hypothetical protein VCR20J5_710042 [Vibrio crassostreae]